MDKQKLKIAMVTDSFYPLMGGSETAIKNLSLGFQKMGHEVKIFGLFEGVKSPDQSLNVVYVSPMWKGLKLRAIARYLNLRKELNSFKPDVVNAHFMLMSGWAGVGVARSLGVASVVSVRGKGVFYDTPTLKRKLLYWVYRTMSLKSNMMIATSQEMADKVNERWGRSPVALSNGVDTEHFKPGIKTDLKEKLGLGGKKVILCVRRFVYKNGIQYMIYAMPEILKNVKDAVLVLVAPKEREYVNLKKMVDDLGIEDKVVFVGGVDHDILPEYYAIADVVTQPSIAEARSLSCLEALASGSALVVTSTGGLGELVDNHEDGIVIPEFEPSTYQVGEIREKGVHDLANAVIDLFSNDDLRHKVKLGARQKALKNSWPNICGQTVDIYRQAIEKNNNGNKR